MAEKKKSNIWLYISIILIIVVIVLLGIVFLGKGNNNSDDFEKKKYCHSFYDEVYNQYDKEYDRRDEVMTRYMSNFDLFYSKKIDTCIVSYIVDTYVNRDNENATQYTIKDYLNETEIYSCFQSDKNLDDYKKDCYSNMLNKLEELK